MKYSLPAKGILMILIWLSLAAAGYAQNNFSIGKAPDWVITEKVEFTAVPNTPEEAGSSYMLLLDKQYHAEKEEVYRHVAMRILNENGLQSLSDISITYDPLYQALNIHSIVVYRNGVEINKLKAADFKIIQQETGANEYLYDGRLSALIHLKDIRIGDVLSYSYTIKGRNPIHEGKFYEVFGWQFNEEVNKIRMRLLHDPKRKLHFKSVGKTPRAVVKNLATGLQEHQWESKKVQALIFDSEIPSWYDPTPVTYISEMQNWGDVVQLLKKSYQIEKTLSDKEWQTLEKQLFSAGDNMDEKLTKLLHFVQNDIRYLGLENGISAYKPHPPAQVLQQKFGDCKDKALLLCALLKKLGVEAYPALVNTYLRGTVAEQLPTPAAFNHCIVSMQYQDSTYWFDATSSSQGGTYKTVSLPHYKQALLIKAGENKLQTITDYPHDRREIQEYYHVKKGNEPSELFIITKYKGYEAEGQRTYFKNNSVREIEKGYLNYYASLYPDISLKKELKPRDRGHSFETEEHYEIAQIWQQNQDQEEYNIASFYPLYLNDFLRIPDEKIRQMPYQLNYPLHITEEMVIELPESWSVEAEKKRISNEFFTLDYEVLYDAPIITLRHDFKLHKNHVPANKIAAYTRDMKNARDMLGYEVYHAADGIISNRLSYPMLIAAALLLGVICAGLIMLYKQYDPLPRSHEEAYDSIGGWLFLPAAGLIISVPSVLYSTISWDYFNANVLHRLFEASSPFYNPMLGTITALECLFNLGIGAMAVLLLVLLAKRRTSFPLLMRAYLITNFSFLLLELLILDGLDIVDTSTLTDAYKQMGRALFGCLIWVPYLLVSKRVKGTFTIMRKPVVASQQYTNYPVTEAETTRIINEEEKSVGGE